MAILPDLFGASAAKAMLAQRKAREEAEKANDKARVRSSRSFVKSSEAYRGIAEVAEDMQLPTHVLRFWESKFPTLKPLKLQGGRRMYRPEDIALLKLVRDLLHNQGYTIRGVQQYLQKTRKAELKEAVQRHLTPRQVMDELTGIRNLLADSASAE
ncbi:MAG TPA: MerR family transcriptional regulator [Alphaproteobacteria bacterium]|nr:MerR family transcriptional regulator [Alphaproteobacteria bacterium]